MQFWRGTALAEAADLRAVVRQPLRLAKLTLAAMELVVTMSPFTRVVRGG